MTRHLYLLAVVVVACGFDNLDLGNPGLADQVVDREGYALGYSEGHEQALWVSYRLTREEVLNRKSSRRDCFMDDMEIKTGSATSDDYRGSGYDRGHLAPAGDLHFSDKTMLESFFMSNVSPQVPAFNRGIWSKLERQVRRYAYNEGSVVVVTGPIFSKNPQRIGANGVSVPEAFYKVVYDETPPRKMIAFVLPNEASNKPLSEFVCSVDEVERMTGLDFFSALTDAVQGDLESSSDFGSWIIPKRKRVCKKCEN